MSFRIKNNGRITGSDPMSDIFLSYSSTDKQWAKLLADCLQKQGWSVWWDRTIPAGKIFTKVIYEAISNARCMIVVWSRESRESNWVLDEAAEGRDRDILVPVLKEKVKPPMGFRGFQAADLSGWDGNLDYAEFQKLIQDLTSILGPSKQPLSQVEPKPFEPPEPKTPKEKRRGRAMLIGASAVLALLILIIGLVSYKSKGPETTPPANEASQQNLNRISSLIHDLFSVDAKVRIGAYGELIKIQGWQNDPNVLHYLVKFATQNMENLNGIYNTVVVLNEFKEGTFKVNKNKQEALKFLEDASTKGPKIAAEAAPLIKRLGN